MLAVELFVPGRPVPQPRMTQKNKYRFRDHAVWGWREKMAWAVKEKRDKSWPLKCEVGLGLEFTVPEKGKIGDLGNYEKACEDCLQNIAFVNDSQVAWRPFARRVRGELLGVRIRIEWREDV